ncbi:MAG: type II toxin-antitoxin system Phd/YefM family antitoxin [Planctomycetaceae bacterium]
MKVYTFSEARQQLATLLDRARRDGQARIRRRDGQEFVVQPLGATESAPFDVPGLRLRLSPEEIVAVVREGRRSTSRLLPSPATKRRGRKGSRGRRR